MAEAIIPRRTINKQEYVLLADVTVGTATTNLDINGLNIGKDEEIVLVSDVKNIGTNNIIRLFCNGNNTATNYYNQYITANNTTISANRSNDAWFMFDSSGLFNFFQSIKLTNNGYFVYQSKGSNFYGGSSIRVSDVYTTSTFTATSITSLRISGSVTNGIDAGSRFQLYKVGA